jgi:glycosyltransferase involved in cell wall biosynthesis
MEKIFFYPHAYLRDRQIDTIRRWRADHVVNPELALNRRGSQVSYSSSNAKKIKASWKQKLPLLNIKLRPSEAPKDVVIYIWGGLLASGDFIVDLDNPWSLVGYNLSAMPFYKSFLRRALLAKRCLEIRCMSEACRLSLAKLFGDEVYHKAKVHYPYMQQAVSDIELNSDPVCRFLFIATQFEIKGGKALLQAFKRLHDKHSDCRLDVITHLPDEFKPLVSACDGIVVYEANFSRQEIHRRFMRHADVLVLPTFVDSFGMVALEALAHGLALITTDLYALGEMVEEGVNGNLICPPVSIWNGVMPSPEYYELANIKQRIRNTDTREFEEKLEHVMKRFVQDEHWRLNARRASLNLLKERFAC